MLNIFFMDLIDNFCFTSMEEPPEKKVLDALLEFITKKTLSGDSDKMGTKELSPFQEHGIDSSPVVRSFLLQLCLKCDKKLAHEHIETFMTHKKALLNCEDEVVEFSQLYMNCVQDVNLQRIYNSDKDIDTVLILKSIEILDENMNLGVITDFDIPSLDSFSNIRLALGQVSKVSAKYIEDPDTVVQNRYMVQLIKLANQFLAQTSNSAKEFLVREICMKYRADAVYEMKRHPCLLELLPEELVRDKNAVPDLFHVPGKHYQEMKSQIIKGLIQDDFSELKNYLENNPDQQAVNGILLAIFNCLYLQNEVEVTPEGLNNLNAVMEDERNRWYRLPKVSYLINRMLQTNMGVFDINENESQREIEIKKIAFLFRSNLASTQVQNGLLSFFQELVFSPEVLQLKFLPSMPHDVTFEIITEMKKEIDKTHKVAPKFFLCPNNHVYTIGDCTNPVGRAKCVDCGTDIGAQQYGLLLQGNKLVEGEKDKTKTGYSEVNENQTKEGTREMTLYETSILKLLIHVGLFSACLEKLAQVSDLCQKPEEDLVRFLLGQINTGITAASKHVGKSQDDIIFLITSLVSDISTWEGNIYDLLSHKSRIDWEKEFVIKMKGVDNRIKQIKKNYDEAVETDDTSSLGALHTLLHGEAHYETAQDKLWQVRFRVTADNLMEWLVSNN